MDNLFCVGALYGGAPAACGALGKFDAEAVARIAARLPGAREIHRDDASVLFAHPDPVAWTGENERGLAWPERVPARIASSRSWREAAAAGGCGLVLMTDGRRGLHASGSGVGPLYWTGDREAIYFATTVDALVAVDDHPLLPDWQSWASILVLGYPSGAGTPFEGIKRMGPLGLLEGRVNMARRVSDGELAWADTVPGDPDEVPERLASALRKELAALDSDLPIICPLSGGYDSRLLACLLAERQRPKLTTWTVNIDQGNELEEACAAAVSAELGVPHRIVPVGDRPFATQLEAAARSVEHESLLHLEMGRLAQGLPEDGVVVDGLAGDVLFKDLFVDRSVVEAPDWRAAVERFFGRLVTSRLGSELYRAHVWRGLYESARDGFLGEAERFAEHPSAPSLAGYWSRTRRGVSTSPARVLGGGRPVAMPFLADDVARAALSASLEAKLDGALYRRLLQLVNPAVADLPSTNDHLPPPPATRPRINRSREARNAYLDLLERSPVRVWFSERLEASVKGRKLGPLVRSPWLLARLHQVCNLTLWTDRYRERLASVCPPDPFPAAGD
jgi:Asparagine synthase